MKKTLNFSYRLALLALCSLALCLLCSCKPSEPEKIDYKTSLSVSSSFSGSRTFTVTYPSSISPGSSTAETLERIISDNCPKSMTYKLDTSSGKVAYTFVLSFSSFSDYNSKLTDILGSKPGITFAKPDNALATGWRIEESFQSCQLAEWIQTAAHAEQISDFDIPSEESTTTVTYNNETINTIPAINVKSLSGTPIKNIKINTVNKTKLFDRTIVFTISQAAFDSIGNKATDYFKGITDPTAEADWSLDKGEYKYTVAFTNLTLKQLEGYTNRLLSSVYGDAEYTDKSSGNNPLSYQNSFTETIDLSNYVSENNTDVPLEYIYTVSSGAELDNCRIYRDFKWVNADTLTNDNNPGKVVGISERSANITLSINDGKQYTPEKINISLTPLDNDQLQKSFIFYYDITQGGIEASNYTASYFRNRNIPTEESSADNMAICKVTFSGTPAELNSKITDIFGDDNLITFSSSVPAMTLRTTKHIEDTVDLSSILVGKNLETPLSYTVIPRNGDNTKYLSLTKDAESDPAYAEMNKDGQYSIELGGSKGIIKTDVSVANVSDIIVFCAVSVIMILVAIALILIIRNKKPSPHLSETVNDSTRLQDGEKTPRLEEKKSLIKLKKDKKH